MLTEAKLKLYRNSEFIEFIGSTVELINRSGLTILNDAKASLALAYKDLDTSFKVSTGSVITTTVQELDARRDAAITGLAMISKAYTYYFDPEISAAGVLVSKEISKYGTRIAQQTYQAETASLKSLVKDFDTNTEVKAALTLLSLNTWVTELKAANEAFDAAYLDRLADMAEKKVVPVSEQRPAAIAAYEKFLQHLQAHSILSPSEALTNLTKQLDVMVKKYNSI